MRRVNSSIIVDFNSEKGMDKVSRTFFAYVPLEDMACYAVAESYDGDTDINSAQLAVESVLTAFERNPSFKNLKKYINYAHDQIVANSVKNKLEVAITVVITDYTRIRYASCGNIKLYLISDNAFYLKGETQTYYQFAENEYGKDKATVAENKNLLQYLGKKNDLRPYISPKIELLEESTMLFSTCGFWERVEDIEILDAYEESKPDELLGNLQEMYLLTQLKSPTIRSYTLASLYVEKTYKEDTAKKKKRRRLMLLFVAIAIILVIIAFIVISIIRANDRRLMSDIEKLDAEGIRYSNYGNYSMAYEQYEKASELTGKLKNNLQYVQAKKDLVNTIAIRWHLFNSIIIGDEFFEGGDYQQSLHAYEDAQYAYYDVYETAEMQSESRVAQILDDKLERVKKYILIEILINIGELYGIEELYQDALETFKEADDIVRTVDDLDLRRKLITLIFETNRSISNSIEDKVIISLRALMNGAEKNMDYVLALQYCDSIIDIYDNLGIVNQQSMDDRGRIVELMNLDEQTKVHKGRAETAESESRYEDAIDNLETLLAVFEEMNMSTAHVRYTTIVDEISRLKGLIRERDAAAGEEIIEETVEDLEDAYG